MSPAPKIIAFEGVDGAGKSTVLRHVAESLRGRGQAVHVPRSTKEHDSRPARMIRRVTRDPRNLALDPRTELLLYCAREAQILQEEVRPALARGETVLLDRSLLTPIVLGHFGRGLPREDCERAAGLAGDGLVPDLTLVFDVHPRTSRLRRRMEKVRSRGFRDRGRKGLSGSALKERVRAGYESVARERGYPVLRAERATPQTLAERVLTLLEGGQIDAGSEDAIPVWRVSPEASLGEAIGELEPAVAVYFTCALRAGRELRAGIHAREPALAAWAMDHEDPLRDQIASREPHYALQGLAGRPLESRDVRVMMADEHPAAVLRALTGVGGAEADALRRRLAGEAPGALVESLQGREDELAAELRAKHWERADAYERTVSLTGCDGEDAWERRTELLQAHAFIGLESLVGVDPERSETWLERHADRAPRAVLSALAGRSDPQSYAWRRRLHDTGREVVDSLQGLDDPEAWDLREQWCERWPSTVVGSLLGVAETPRRQALTSRCGELGRGDVHVLRRLTQLDEYAAWPDWAKMREAGDR